MSGKRMQGQDPILKIACTCCGNDRDIGKVAAGQYFCWKCGVELSVKQGMIKAYQVEWDGTLSPLDDLFPSVPITI